MDKTWKGEDIGRGVSPVSLLNKQLEINVTGEFEPVRIKCLVIFAETKALGGRDLEGMARVFPYADIDNLRIL